MFAHKNKKVAVVERKSLLNKIKRALNAPMKTKSQAEVARELGVKPYNLRRWLAGRSRPRLEEAERLVCIAHGTTVFMWLHKKTTELKKALGVE